MHSLLLTLLASTAAPLGPAGSPLVPVLQAEDAAAETELQALIERHNKAQQDVFKAYGEAATDEEKQKILAGLPGKEYVPEFLAIATKARGTDTAARALIWAGRLSEDPKEKWSFVQTLLEEHMQSAVLAELTGELRYAAYEHGHANVVEALRAIVAESPHERVRAGALFTLGAVLLESQDPASKAEGRDCLEAVVVEYGKLAYGGNSTYEAAANGYLYELDNLQVGMTAPDFETVDENGAKWKLSDYRGKVVIVDFWGFW
jgi:hypothetical protein